MRLASTAIGAALLVGLLTAWPAAAQDAAPMPGGVRLLKYPYPYQAAVTIASDADGANVERFAVVHALINTTLVIERGSAEWRLLFGDPEIERRPEWRAGVPGFGLDLADSFFLYDKQFGVFADIDEERGEPVPHAHGGRDFRELYEEWFAKGWIDTLHTPAFAGDYRREAVRKGLDWLQAKPERTVRVWSNHRVTSTPLALGWSTQPALPVALRNLAKLGTAALWRLGARSFVNRFAQDPYPRKFPYGQGAFCWTLAALLVLSAVWLLLCLAWRRLRTRRAFLAGGLVLAATCLTLYLYPLRYAQGDDPRSPYYVADLLRSQFRYYWLASDAPGCAGTYVRDMLALPEQDFDGRDSILCVAQLRDGSSVLAFRVAFKGSRGYRSLELLTDEALEDLCRRGGTAILHTHWTWEPPEVFTAKALDGLSRLRRHHDEGRVWVAPLSQVLHFTHVRTFLDYRVRSEDGVRIIEISGLKNPVGDLPRLGPEDLRGLGFECPLDGRVEIRVGGAAPPEPPMEVRTSDGRRTVHFPLTPTRRYP